MTIEGVGGGPGPSISEGDQGDAGGVSEISTEATDTELEPGFVDSPDIDPAANDPDVASAEPAEATLETAVQEVWDLPVPSYTELSGIPESASAALYEQSVISYNAERAELAQAALDQFAPTPEMFDALPPAMAAAEFEIALADYNSNAFVGELGRLRDEATIAPDALPTDPFNVDPGGINVAELGPDQVRSMAGALGIELPTHVTGADIDAARELISAVPADLLATALSPGMEISFTGQPGVSTPGFLPARVEGNLAIEGTVALSEVRTGAGFIDTQQLSLQVEVRTEVGVTNTRTAIQKVYGRLSGLGLLSPAAQQLIDSTALTRNQVRSAPARGSYETFSGDRISYEATVTAEQGALIAEGTLAAPNPFDPLSMPQGTSVMIRGQELTGTYIEAAYRGLSFSGRVTELDGTGFGVTRLEGDRVQVVSGPVSAVENSAFFGLGNNTVGLGLGVDRSLEDQALQIAEIDLSTASGREAYSSFLSTGQIPSSDGVGVVRSGTSEVLTYNHSAGAEINLGPLSGSLELNSSNVTQVRTQYDDGTVSYDSTVRINGRTLDFDFVTDAQGNIVPEATSYTIIYTGTSALSAEHAELAFDLDAAPALEGQQDVQLTFSHEQIMELRDLARAQDSRFGFIEQLGSAPTAEAAARLFLNTPTGFFESSLLGLALDQGVAGLPGQMQTRAAGD